MAADHQLLAAVDWPEGIAAKGKQLLVGSIPTGEVRRVDARSGDVDPLVPARTGRAAVGLKIDQKKRLCVAGGPTGKAFVYDARDGKDLAQFQLAPRSAQTFVSDVALTRRAAYFTDSRYWITQVKRQGLAGGRIRAVPPHERRDQAGRPVRGHHLPRSGDARGDHPAWQRRA